MRTPRSKSGSTARRAASLPDRTAAPAVVARLDEDPDVVFVRESLASEERRARVAVPAYKPAERDRVLVLTEGDERWVIGVLRAARPLEATLPDGASVRVEGGAVEIKDERGRMLVRYENGTAHVAAPGKDLVLDAPEGQVIVRGGKSITLEAAEEISQKAGRKARVEAPELEAKSSESRVVTGRLSVTAEHIVTAASVLAQSAERFEVHAERIVEKTRDAYRDATGLVQTRAGRVREIVEGVYTLFSKRTQIASEDDTSIDGKRVLLG